MRAYLAPISTTFLLLFSSITFSATDPFTRLSDNLYLYKDICNVYVLKNLDRAILIDFGSGKILQDLNRIGVSKVEWVLHTHYHRDQAQGDYLLDRSDTQIAVPDQEFDHFGNVDKFWQDVVLYDNYRVEGIFYTLRNNIKVNRRLSPGDRFEWGNVAIDVLDGSGHTPNALAFCTKIDGINVAFVNDLISSSGKIHTLYDFQVRYDDTVGVTRAENSFKQILSKEPDILLPSHGLPVNEPQDAVTLLMSRLKAIQYLVTVQHILTSWNVRRLNWNPIEGVTPHVYRIDASQTYFVIGDNGHALMVDNGTRRPGNLDSVIADLKKYYGLKSIDFIFVTHFHDDHVGGINHIVKTYGSQVWALDEMADILENPFAYNLPCLYPESIRVDRRLKDREEFDWDGFHFKVYHAPGHTEYAEALFAVIDGKRLCFSGDSIFMHKEHGLSDDLNCRNYPEIMRGGFIEHARNLIEMSPDIILPAHFSIMYPTTADLQQFLKWSEKTKNAFINVLDSDPVMLGVDPNWASIYPYRNITSSARDITISVRIRNHYDVDANGMVKLCLPVGWKSNPDVRECAIPKGSTSEASFRVLIPASAGDGRRVITADITINGREYGEYAEGLIDVVNLR